MRTVMKTNAEQIFDLMNLYAVRGLIKTISLRQVSDRLAIPYDAVRASIAVLCANGTLMKIGRNNNNSIYRVLDPDRVLEPAPPGAGIVMTELKQRIRELWGTGQSTSAMAAILGITKNSLIGHAHRMMLPSLLSPIRRRDPDAPSRVVPPRPAGIRTLPPLPSVTLTPPVATASPLALPVIERPVISMLTMPPLRFNFQPAAINRRDAPTPRPEVIAIPVVVEKNRKCQFPLWGDNKRPTHVYCERPAERSWCEDCRKKVFIRHRVTEMTEDRTRTGLI